MALPSDKEASAQFKDKMVKSIETLKYLQQTSIPDMVKVSRNFQASLSVQRDAGEKLNMAWELVALGVGPEKHWGSRTQELATKFKELQEIECEWDEAWEKRFVQPISMALLTNEGKRTHIKEAEIKKAISRLEKEAKNAESVARKKMKKRDANAADEYKDVLASVEHRRNLIEKDWEAHCEQSYFILTQAFCQTLKEKVEIYERIHTKSIELASFLAESAKVQPDLSAVPSAEEMREVYADKKVAGSKRVAPGPDSRGSGRATTPRNSTDSDPDEYGSLRRTNSSNYTSQQPPPRSSPRQSNSVAMRVRAKWSFSADREGELSMQPGDVLTVVENTGSWWKAELNGQVGNIPANYIEIIEDDEDLPSDLPAPVDEPADEFEPPPAAPAMGRGRGLANSGQISTGRGRGDPPAGRSAGLLNGGSSGRGIARGRAAPIATPSPGSGGRGTIGRGAPTPAPGGRGTIGRGAPAGGRGRGAPELAPPPILATPVRNTYAEPEPEEAPAPLPEDEPAGDGDWQEYFTPEGLPYYHNHATGETKWTRD